MGSIAPTRGATTAQAALIATALQSTSTITRTIITRYGTTSDRGAVTPQTGELFIDTTLNTLYQTLAGIIGVEGRPIYHPDRAGEQMRYALDASKAKRDLGWAPMWALEDGLRQTVTAALGER